MSPKTSFILGNIYENGYFDGIQVLPEFDSKVMSSPNGDSKVMPLPNGNSKVMPSSLGKNHSQPMPKKCFYTALYFYKTGAINNCMFCQHKLGLWYGAGVHSLSIDHEGSLEWMTMAANQGHPESQYNIAKRYFEASGGVNVKDPKKAFEWCLLAAEQQYAPAQEFLYFMDKNGIGKPKNSLCWEKN